MQKEIFFCLLVSLYFLPVSHHEQTGLSLSNHRDSVENNLFGSDKVLNITLEGNVRELLNDRSGTAIYYPFILTCKNENDAEASIPINVKTRGHFRREKTNCFYPPLLLSIPKTDSASVFPTNAKLKLGMPCKGEDFVVYEWLVYKLYNLVTPQSFRARLVKVNLKDTKNKKMVSPFYGIILEEENQMAARNNLIVIKKKLSPQEINLQSFLRMAVFEYFIGNTDWSVEYLQNIKLLARDSASVPFSVPYDFDLSGFVNAPYAKPAEELQMNSVRERRYRGYCIKDMKIFDSTIAFYNGLKSAFYKTITDCPFVDSRYKKETLKYFDEFYAILDDPSSLKKEFQYPCSKYGTGNVIIKGLRED